jgi:hypothetical protein
VADQPKPGLPEFYDHPSHLQFDSESSLKSPPFISERGGARPEIDDLDAKPAAPAIVDVGELLPPRHDRLVFRCTPEFHAWVAALGDFMGVGMTTILEQSLRVYAESRMFPIVPPRRFVASPRPRPGRRKVH